MKRRRRRKKKKKKSAARRVVEPRDAKDTCSGEKKKRSCECARSLWLDERERNRRIAKNFFFFDFLFCALPLDFCACIKSLMKYLHMYMHM